MYIDNPGNVYGCTSCGEVMGEIYEGLGTPYLYCKKCNTPSIITLVQALDVLYRDNKANEFDPDNMMDVIDIAQEIHNNEE